MPTPPDDSATYALLIYLHDTSTVDLTQTMERFMKECPNTVRVSNFIALVDLRLSMRGLVRLGAVLDQFPTNYMLVPLGSRLYGAPPKGLGEALQRLGIEVWNT
jgi:hypothetical protein